MPPCCVSSSSSSPPRSHTAIGNIRPPRWWPSTTTSSKILRSSAGPWCCSSPVRAASASIKRCRRRAERRRAERQVHNSLLARRAPSASGGMRQRVSIARAFANDPEILLMDEPFSALDAQNKLLLQEELLHIWEEHKKTVVFITHSVDEAVFLGDRIMVMTAQPGKVKTFVPVPLARPRNIMELQKMPQYGELIAHIWSSLREEVHRARQQEEEMKS